jgi:hypothetical protein
MFFCYKIIRPVKSLSCWSSYTQVFSQIGSTSASIMRFPPLPQVARLSRCFTFVLFNADESDLQEIAGIIYTLNSDYFLKKHCTNGSVRLLLVKYSSQSPINLTYRDFTHVSPRKYLCINSNRARPLPSISFQLITEQSSYHLMPCNL